MSNDLKTLGGNKSGSSELIAYVNDVYRTTRRPLGWISRTFPTFHFYRQFGANVLRSSRVARLSRYNGTQWALTSHQVLEALESVGVEFEISGLDHVRRLQSPCVFIGNHMSMLETMVLPAIIQPIRDVTFVVKRSLLEYPVFCHILRSRDPIAVSRIHPREDFKVVINGGRERLDRGISVVVFPQTTRADSFDAAQFNTIGIKLASRAGVPVVPIALRTNAWGNGKRIKDLGPIDVAKKVHFAFGPPIDVQGRGDRQHQEVIDFIESKLAQWTT